MKRASAQLALCLLMLTTLYTPHVFAQNDTEVVKVTQSNTQFAIDLYNEVFKKINENVAETDVKAIMLDARAFVINSDVFDNHALACKIDLVLNDLIRSRLVKLAIDFADDNVRIGFRSMKK